MKIHVVGIAILIFACTGKSQTNTIENKAVQGITKVKKALSSKILFARKHNTENGWSIFAINPDGTEEKIIIPYVSGQGEYNPDISPDGTTVLFNSYRFGGWKLVSTTLLTKESKRISSSTDYYFNGSYSPDGNQIAYEKVGRGEKTQIYISDKNGGKETLVSVGMKDVENRMPVWSPDGTSIIFYSNKNGSTDIYRYDTVKKDITNLTKTEKGNNFNPSVSPDGKKIAFFSDRNGYLDLYIMDNNGTNSKNLTAGLHNKNNEYNYYKNSNLFWLFKCSWSPDGKSLVFSNANTTNIDLFTIKKDGTELQQITKTEGSELTPVWGMIDQQ